MLRPRRWLTVLPCFGLLALTGCGLLDFGANPKKQQADARAGRLLSDLVEAFTGEVELSGEQIAAASDDTAIDRLSVHYRMRLCRAARTTLGYRDPHVGLLDLWTLCLQAERYLGDGAGKQLFGAQQDLAVAAVRRSATQIADLTKGTFEPEQRQAAQRDVESFAQEHPMYGHFARIGLLEGDVKVDGQDGRGRSALLQTLTFDWINPLSGFGSDVTEGAAAVGAAMDRFTVAAEGLPRQLGWQLEMFVYDLDDAKAVRSAVDGTARVASGVDHIAALAEDLPRRLRSEIEVLLQGLGPTLEQLRATLAEARASAAPIGEAGQRWGNAAQQVEAMAQRLTGALTQFDATYRLLDGGDKPSPETETAPSRPFDIREYERTARSIRSMSEELQHTLESFRRTVEAPGLDQTLDKAEGVAGGAAATVFLWVLLGSAVVLGLVLLVVFGLRRMLRRHRAAPVERGAATPDE